MGPTPRSQRRRSCTPIVPSTAGRRRNVKFTSETRWTVDNSFTGERAGDDACPAPRGGVEMLLGAKVTRAQLGGPGVQRRVRWITLFSPQRGGHKSPRWWPARCRGALSRWSTSELAHAVVLRGIGRCISGATVLCWLHADRMNSRRHHYRQRLTDPCPSQTGDPDSDPQGARSGGRWTAEPPRLRV